MAELSGTQRKVLIAIVQNDGSHSLPSLGWEVSLKQSSAAQVCAHLQRLGCLTRDGSHFSITEAGRRAISENDHGH
jgi:DNA-binding IclR family transcriptional regulator